MTMSRNSRRGVTRYRRRWPRLLSGLGLAALVFATVGDRGIAAVTGGIDPLDLLSLQTRPNAIVVLDSSGSMGSTLSNAGIGPGDHTSAKMYLAKQVLKTVIQNNQATVNFQFGKYRNTNITRASRAYIYTSTATRAVDGSMDADVGSLRFGGTFTNASGQTERILTTSTYYVNRSFKYANGGDTECASAPAFTGPTWTAPAGDWRDAPPYIDVWYRANSSCGTTSQTSYFARFYFRGVSYNDDSGASCGGYDPLTGIADCTNLTEFSLIAPFLDPEVTPTATDGSTPADTTAVKTAGFTPIANSLADIKGTFDSTVWPTIASYTPKPRTFVIFVTDGDDTCAGQSSNDDNALEAAYRAQLLRQGNGTDPENEVTVFVIAFGAGLSKTRANWIAWGGSGMTRTPTGTGDQTRWASAPASKAGCATCFDAFVAADADQLAAVLQAAIDAGQSSGTFSDQQSITESIYEYSALASCTPAACDPLNPETRYNSSIPVLLQTTFDMPAFDGHLNAFRNEAGAALKIWDAGQKLADRIASTSLATEAYTFQELNGDATATTIATSGARIKRRVYTTRRLGVSSFLDGTDSAIVSNLTTASFVPAEQTTLWPPGNGTPSACTTTSCVDPVCSSTACPVGVLDTALGLAAASYADVAAVRAAFPGVCTAAASGAALPAACSRKDFAIKEARQILLARVAGATLDTDSDLAVRANVLGCQANTAPCLRFRTRPWIMADSTLSAPGVVAPPLQANPKTHLGEYQIYRDGIRDGSGHAVNGYSSGFGLRNPDKDGQPGSQADTALKPNMTLVLHPTNEMLHAFRGGPCPAGCTETGGEELWAFVSYDQLGKLKERLTKTQTRTDHTYMFAAPVRFADVFVPGNFSMTIGGVPVSGNGVWRTVALIGRGIGGKYLTALDITTPGRLTDASLTGPAPIHLWTRGNPDTQNGLTSGTKNNQSGNTAATYDYNAYALMGETWSVPTISFVTAADNETRRKSNGVEFVAFVGSGFSAISTEGSTFYALDVLTGDVIGTNAGDGYVNVGDRSGMGFENAIVANPAAFSPLQLRKGFVGHPASSETTYLYVGDVHGRFHRFKTSASDMQHVVFGDLGSNQPVGNAAALLYYRGTEAAEKPHVFVETGNDRRVAPYPPGTTPPFRMYGFRDDDLTTDADTSDGVDGPAKVLFTIDFPDNFRGTTQPATAYDANDPPNGRVFFVGTRFNPPGAPSPFEAPVPPPCVSSFDSILFAVGAESGGAAYDFGGSEYYKMSGQRVQGVRVAGGQLVLDTGLQAQNPPPPPAPPVVLPPVPSPISNVRFGSSQTNNNGLPIPGTMPFISGSTTCR
jgi:hypothetical protein